jgi:hypothetical protein
MDPPEVFKYFYKINPKNVLGMFFRWAGKYKRGKIAPKCSG